MNTLALEAFISMIEMPEERRSGYERRVKDVGSMEEKRRSEDRRKEFNPKNSPHYYKKTFLKVFDEFMRDRDRKIPLVLKTNGEKIISGPTDIIKDWIGWDLEKVDLSAIYVDPESRLRVLADVNENEFTRFYPHVYKANGEKLVLDVLMTAIYNKDGSKEYWCFVGIAD